MAALGELFKGVLENGVGDHAVVFDYGKPADFGGLWDAGNGTPAVLNELNGKRAVIIVWDGRAWQWGDDSNKKRNSHNETLLAPHLTPLDWALAFSIKELADPSNASLADFHIHIVDLRGKAHDNNEWAMRMRHQLLAEMPWVTLHAPLIPKITGGGPAVYREKYEPILDGENSLLSQNNGAWQLNQTGKTLAEGIKQGRGNDLVGLARQWAASLTQSHDHHDLNNVVGPWIVLSGLDAEIVRPAAAIHSGGFYTRLEWMGFLPKKRGEDGYLPFQQLVEIPFELEVLAIDDEIDGDLTSDFDNSWGNVLKRLLNADQARASLVRCSDPELLLIPLGIRKGGTTSDENLYRRRTFDHPLQLVFNKTASRKPCLLVLDLHLFSGRRQVDELRWFQTLLTVAEKLIDSSGLAWPGFSSEEIDHLKTWLGMPFDREDPAYDTALSLLPRLCALRWPSVPIMVFSVTGRRRLIAKLSGYGNIFLAASKPNVFVGDAEEQVHAFAESWRREFKAAMKLVEVQERLTRLYVPRTSPSTQGGHGNHCHVVIALDETGQWGGPTKAIGSVMLFAYGANETDARNTSVDFQELLRQGGVHYYDCVPYYFDCVPEKVGAMVNPRLLKQKGTPAYSEVQAVMANHPQSIKMGFIRYCLGNQNPSHAGFNDEAYLRGLSRVLEMLFAEFLPSAGFDLAKTTFSIWLPSKQSQDFVTSTDAKNHSLKFDFRHEPPRTRVETIGGYGSAYSVLLRAVGERTRFPEVLRSICLKTRTIPYANTGQQPPRQSALHWYCDQCGHVLHPRTERNGDPIQCRPNPLSHRTACTNNLVADYSVMLHLADEMITTGSFGNGYFSSLAADLCFDVEESERTLDFLHAARLFDRGLQVDGFKAAYKHGFFLDGVKTNESFPAARIETRLVGELAEYASEVDGNTLIALAGLPTHVASGIQSGPARLDAGHHRGNRNPQGSRRNKSYNKSGRSDHHSPQKPQSPKSSVKPQQPLSVVLTGFLTDISESNVAERVYGYLTINGISIAKDQVQPGESNQGNLKCDLYGLSKEQCERVKGLKTSPDGTNPPWRNCNAVAPAR